MTTDAVMDQAVTNAEAAATAKAPRKQSSLTADQKKASGLRRDAAILERLAPSTLEPGVLQEKAKVLRAQADKLAPAQVKVVKVSGLTEAEWDAVTTYFISDDFRTKIVFAKGVGGFSLKQLKAIAQG